MKIHKTIAKKSIKAIALAVAFVFLAGSVACPASFQYEPKTATLSPQSRMQPFFEKHGLEFQNVAAVVMAASELKKLATSKEIREGAIYTKVEELNRLFKNSEVEIEKEIKSAAFKCSGKEYKYAVFHFKKEDKTINVLFFKDHSVLTPAELTELRIKDTEKHHLDCPGLEGVWFIKPIAIKENTGSPDVTFWGLRKLSATDLAILKAAHGTYYNANQELIDYYEPVMKKMADLERLAQEKRMIYPALYLRSSYGFSLSASPDSIGIGSVYDEKDPKSDEDILNKIIEAFTGDASPYRERLKAVWDATGRDYWIKAIKLTRRNKGYSGDIRTILKGFHKMERCYGGSIDDNDWVRNVQYDVYPAPIPPDHYFYKLAEMLLIAYHPSRDPVYNTNSYEYRPTEEEAMVTLLKLYVDSYDNETSKSISAQLGKLEHENNEVTRKAVIVKALEPLLINSDAMPQELRQVLRKLVGAYVCGGTRYLPKMSDRIGNIPASEFIAIINKELGEEIIAIHPIDRLGLKLYRATTMRDGEYGGALRDKEETSGNPIPPNELINYKGSMVVVELKGGRVLEGIIQKNSTNESIAILSATGSVIVCEASNIVGAWKGMLGVAIAQEDNYTIILRLWKANPYLPQNYALKIAESMKQSDFISGFSLKDFSDDDIHRIIIDFFFASPETRGLVIEALRRAQERPVEEASLDLNLPIKIEDDGKIMQRIQSISNVDRPIPISLAQEVVELLKQDPVLGDFTLSELSDEQIHAVISDVLLRGWRDNTDIGGTMGRWKYTHTTLTDDGTLTLHNATRIPRKDGVIEEEFLVDGQNKPRDILLKTRGLNAAEKETMAVLRQELAMNIEPRAIVRDDSAMRNRIYGVAAEGAPFIREDIIAKGNPQQIREALDHENRELTSQIHDNIRKEQHRGDLRSLITQLSGRDKAEKEALRIHAENLKYASPIPAKTILCHIIADSILPVEQRNMLKELEQDMRGKEYSEKVICLSGINSDTPEEFVATVEKVKVETERMYKEQGIEKIEFVVACPRTDLVSKVQDRMGIKALAFKPYAKEGANIAQVEGIMLALRALHSGKIENLQAAFKFITGTELPPDLLEVRDMNELARRIVFILPSANAINYGEIRELNDIIRKNIESAA